MWLYLHFGRTRRAVMAARVLASGGDTSNSSSRRLIVLALSSSNVGWGGGGGVVRYKYVTVEGGWLGCRSAMGCGHYPLLYITPRVDDYDTVRRFFQGQRAVMKGPIFNLGNKIKFSHHGCDAIWSGNFKWWPRSGIVYGDPKVGKLSLLAELDALAV